MRKFVTKIAIGADHRGFTLKEVIIDIIKKSCYEINDYGAFRAKRCDYPPIAFKVASGVASGKFDRGILICKSGLGMSIVANKVPGIRAALLHNIDSARSSRKHNDANVAVFSEDSIDKRTAKKILKVWLTAEFSGGRHARRLKQIRAIEKKLSKTTTYGTK